MKEILKPLILGLSIIVSVIVLSCAITYFSRSRDVISVTGLGETTFTSDLIVWEGQIVVENADKLAGYKQIEQNQTTVSNYLIEHGITIQELTFNNVNIDKQFTSRYTEKGDYIGQAFVGWRLTQRFIISSSDVDKVEEVSRQISSLISEGVDIEADAPSYYYTHLDEMKLALIEKASKDAYQRAENIANNAGGKLGKASYATLGVFQITSPTGNEEYSYGGCFNTSSKEKKARITVRMQYQLK